MPIFTNPEFQRFVEQQTGANPVEAVKSHLPASFTQSTGAAVYPRGFPISTQLGESTYDALERKQFLKPIGDYVSSLGQDSGRTALMTALALGIGGAGYGALTGRNPVTFGLAGAGIGALGGYGASELVGAMQRHRQLRTQNAAKDIAWEQGHQQRLREAAMLPWQPKFASYYGEDDQDPMTYIQSRLFADQTLGTNDKSMLMANLQALPPQQLFTLSNLLHGSIGAAAGYLITRFLLNLGSTGQAIGSAAGGVLGMMVGSRFPTNAFGEHVDTSRDMFGNRRFVN